MPKVSVIIPTYNRANFIARAIESVLKQNYHDYEIIIVDDGSKDNTRDVIAPYKDKAKYIYQNNSGVSAARNRGITESCGEYIAFLDSDDCWLPEKLDEQVKVLDAHPKIGLVYARMPIINAKGEKIGMKPAGFSGRNFHELLHQWGDLPTSTVMTRKACFEKAGLFDVRLSMSEDTEMWIRIAKFYDLYEIEGKILAHYYRHDDQLTTNRIRVFQEQIKTDLRIMEIHSEAPRAAMTKNIALNEYLTAKAYYVEKNYNKSLTHICKAFQYHPPLGTLFFKPGDNLFNKTFKMIKPFGLFTLSFFRSIFVPSAK